MKMVATLVGLVLSLLSGCSLLGGGSFKPTEVKPVEVVTVVKEAPMYHPPPPGAISAMPVEWTVLTPAIMQEYLDDLEKGEAPMNVWYSLTSKGYENLSYNMAEIKRYLRQTKSIIQYYSETDSQSSGGEDDSEP
jgi:hypothetical protein